MRARHKVRPLFLSLAIFWNKSRTKERRVECPIELLEQEEN
jgi:hypothetical protein